MVVVWEFSKLPKGNQNTISDFRNLLGTTMKYQTETEREVRIELGVWETESPTVLTVRRKTLSLQGVTGTTKGTNLTKDGWRKGIASGQVIVN